ncbi:MAG: recombinase RecB [Desulfurococcaceae archaeon]|nr:recombinase RecB [Desulfurococcaceae archaeon]
MSSKHGLSPSRRWLSSERIALRVLEELGFKIVETRKKISINGVEVGEIDAIVEDENGVKWGVEIKAGRIDVTGVRQAYVNSIIAEVKPMIICKGFADDAAKELAEKLGVKVMELSDVFLVDSEELEVVIREVMENTLADYLETLFATPLNIKQEWLEVLNAIASSHSIEEACEKLGVDVSTLTRKLSELRSSGVLPQWARKYTSIKRAAQIMLQRYSILQVVTEAQKVLELLKQLRDQLNQLLTTLSNLRKSFESLREGQT